jgi:hypothetical protein
LPLLDALLTDDKFVARLKQDVKLSDEQIESIKRVSSAAITRLRESNAEELDGTNGDPRQRAEQELGSILGAEKTRELARFTNEYWSKGDPAEASNDTAQMLPGPNAVPTDTRVVVNIPAFRMDLFQDGSLVKSYNRLSGVSFATGTAQGANDNLQPDLDTAGFSVGGKDEERHAW